jgi:hypothetical protein
MDREEIIKMARQTGMQGMLTDVVCTHEELVRFAALVAAVEREACAKVCLEEAPSLDGQLCAAAIRARGEQ